MATPTITFRVRPDRQQAVRDLVNAVKDDPALNASLLEHLGARPSPVTGSGEDGAIRNIGPFRDEEAALSFLVGRLKTALRPLAIILFGSRADGSARPDSDFDFLVVLPDGAGGPPDYFAAHAPVAGCGIGVDIVPCRLADFEGDRHHPGTLAHAADSRGLLLYASPDSPFRAIWRAQANRR